MRSVRSFVVAALAVVVLAVPAVVLADGRVALVVGNSTYAHIGRLPNPDNDARDLSVSLRRLGFEVTTEFNVDRVELTEALRAFTRRSAGADVSLVFYAGHGIEMDGVNYLVPVDARLERDVDVRFETVTVDDLLVSTSGASLRLVILDACRNNPLARSALLSVMVYSFARVSAVVGMRRQDYFLQGTRGWLRLHEKGGKRHDVPVHHRAEAAVDAYLVAGGIEDAKAPLFQSVDRSCRLSGRPLTRRVVLSMIKRRAAAAGLPASTCCHTFRATGITAYRSNGGTLEHAQQIAGHASPRTTKLYDRTADTVTLDEIERIVI